MFIADQMKAKVDERGIKYTHLAEISGCSVDMISKCLSGQRRLPAEVFVIICKDVGLDIDDFITPNDPPDKAS